MTSQLDLQPTTKHVLLTLAVFMDEKAECYPSVALLSQRTSLSRASIFTHLKKARKGGWIEITIKGFNGQGWKRHKYKATIPDKVVKEIDHDTDKAVKEVNHVMKKGGQPNREGGQPNRSKVVKEVDTNTIYNTTKNTIIFSCNSDEF